MGVRNQRIVLIVAVALTAAVSPPTTVRADELERIIVQATTLYSQNNRGRVVLRVTNNNSEILDVEVTCQFLDANKKPAGAGHNTVSRLAPHRQDTVEVTDEVAYEVDSVQCAATKIRR